MRIHVALAIFEGCPAAWLNDAEALREALGRAVAAGGFTELATTVVPFSPQGVTACAIVGESHLALHSWPEERRLFVDIASCGTHEGVARALEALEASMPDGVLAVREERTLER